MSGTHTSDTIRANLCLTERGEKAGKAQNQTRTEHSRCG